MKTASVTEIKKVLAVLEAEEVINLCLRMAKYKKDNKELLNYLLFEASDEIGFVQKVKSEVDELFEELPRSNAYLVKKGLRKILKTTNKYIKYANSKTIEIDLLLYFCQKIKQQRFSTHLFSVLGSIWDVQMRKITKSVATLHEELQYDYAQEIAKIHQM
jgi:hypothetical protein